MLQDSSCTAINVNIQVVFVLGRPGSGKGTQCSKIVGKFANFQHVSVGDILRREVTYPESIHKNTLDQYFAAGAIAPAEITVSILLQEIRGLLRTRTSHEQLPLVFLIDGFPLNHDNFLEWQRQANKVNNAQEAKLRVDWALYFDAPEEICLERCLQRGRGGMGGWNDNAANVQRRFVKFQEGVIPLIQHFREDYGIEVSVINTDEEIDRIFQNLTTLFRQKQLVPLNL